MALSDWYFRISVVVLLCVLRRLWNVLYSFWLAPANFKLDFKSYGKWALVTGCTNGIGKEYARQLAAHGCNIVLVSRSLDLLKNVASEIEKEFKVQTKVVEIDFTGDPSIYDKLAKEIQGLEIGTLVNNVGLSYPYLEYFLDLPNWNQFMMNLVNVNVVSMIRVTGLVLPDMVKRGKGIIINMGSSSNNIQSPLLVVYSAVKAFVAKFSDGLRYEYGHKGIIVQCLAPSLISTKMTGLDSNIIVPTPQTYVKKALKMIGTVHRSTGYFPHSCVIFIYNVLEFLSEDFTAWICRQSSEIGRSFQLKKMGLKTK